LTITGFDPAVHRAVTFMVALPIASRSPDPEVVMQEFGFRLTRLEYPGKDPVAQAALRRALAPMPAQASIEGAESEWEYLRRFDRPGFSDLARLYFSELLAEILRDTLAAARLNVEPTLTQRHAWESSKIVQSFSARWFQKCAVDVSPDEGSIRWYIRHCVGKLDMELERELSVQPAAEVARKRRRNAIPPSLGLGI
jgi:hypothetical protein